MIYLFAEVTLDKRDENNKPLLNPNVMIELGYALANIYESQIILLYSCELVKPEEMPFNFKTRCMKFYQN